MEGLDTGAEQVSQRTSVEPVGFGGNGGGSGGGSSFGCETETVAVAVSGVSGDTTRTQAPYVTRAHAHTRICPPATVHYLYTFLPPIVC